MKTLLDLKQHLLVSYIGRINGTLDSGETILIHAEQYFRDREKGAVSVIFYEESGESNTAKSITFDELDNTEASLTNNPELYQMYNKEFPLFYKLLYHSELPMWERLRKLNQID